MKYFCDPTIRMEDDVSICFYILGPETPRPLYTQVNVTPSFSLTWKKVCIVESTCSRPVIQGFSRGAAGLLEYSPLNEVAARL